MAIDTADKRFSALGYPGGLFYVAPTPDGSFDTNEDRVQLLGLYRLAADFPILLPGEGQDYTAGNYRADYTVPNYRADFTT